MIRDRLIFGRKTRSFTLQWHLTNRCPFHCRHCYDRSSREELGPQEMFDVLSDFLAFCRKKKVKPCVSLSGGDPLLHPAFWELYRSLSEKNIPTSILGNPIGGNAIDRLLEIHPPQYYQVSLEGLREHNDFIRGSGHFDLVIAFLKQARRRGLETHVMLTLTRANADQVIPLGDELRGLTTRLTFNRLSPTGEGSRLEELPRPELTVFLHRYLEACRRNPVFGVKDNLFNIIRHQHRRRPFPGCTGFGCGAAFNFVALLPDGEVHACRKFTSRIGNIRESHLAKIYDSSAARRYRNGPAECRKCALRNSCRGCAAVTAGHGLDPFHDRDPHCFFAPAPNSMLRRPVAPPAPALGDLTPG